MIFKAKVKGFTITTIDYFTSIWRKYDVNITKTKKLVQNFTMKITSWKMIYFTCCPTLNILLLRFQI